MHESPRTITKAPELRALGQPARLAILQLLSSRGPQTATALAQQLGISPSLTSYHLRALAAAGFVVPSQAEHTDARQRPWTVVEPDLAFDVDPETGDPEGPSALNALGASMLRRNEEIVTAFSRHRDEYSAEWRRATFIGQSVLALTAHQLDAFVDDLTQLVRKYRQTPGPEPDADVELVLVHTSCTPWRPAGAKE